MKTDLVIFLFLSFLISMQNIISGNQSCSKLQFVQMPEKILAFEGSSVNLTFYLDTRQCSNQTNYTIIISRDDNGRHTDICKFRVVNKCMVSDKSTECFCLSLLGPMLFTTNVTNKVVYIWKWGEIPPLEERRVIFRTDSAGAKVSHVKATESKNDKLMVVVIGMSTGVCLVVIAAVVVTVIICCRRAGRGFDESRLRHGDHKALMVSYTPDTPQTAKTIGDQATDIYEEIGVAPKPHGQCRVSLKNEVSPPPIPDFHLYVKTSCSTPGTDRKESPVEYLLPLVVSGTRAEETAEYRVVTCAQTLTTWRPHSSCL